MYHSAENRIENFDYTQCRDLFVSFPLSSDSGGRWVRFFHTRCFPFAWQVFSCYVTRCFFFKPGVFIFSYQIFYNYLTKKSLIRVVQNQVSEQRQQPVERCLFHRCDASNTAANSAKRYARGGEVGVSQDHRSE